MSGMGLPCANVGEVRVEKSSSAILGEGESGWTTGSWTEYRVVMTCTELGANDAASISKRAKDPANDAALVSKSANESTVSEVVSDCLL